MKRKAAILAAEWVFVMSILILGAITGLVAVKKAINQQLESVGDAILSADTSVEWTGQRNGESATGGCIHIDNRVNVGPFQGPAQLRRSPPSPVWGDDPWPAD